MSSSAGGRGLTSGICGECVADPSNAAHALLSRQHIAQKKLVDTHKICASCSSTPMQDKVLCDSIDCPVMYARVAASRDVEELADIPDLVKDLDEEAALDW